MSQDASRTINGPKAFSAIKETLAWLKRLQKKDGRNARITVQETFDEIVYILQEYEIDDIVFEEK